MLSRAEQRWQIRLRVEDPGLLNFGWGLEAFEGRLLEVAQFVKGQTGKEGTLQIEMVSWMTQRWEDGHALYKAITEAAEPTARGYASYADLDLPPIEWAWRGWMANGVLTLLAAPPGAGKSLIALDLARRVIEGMPAPDGAPLAMASNRVIYVDAEDMPRLTVDRGRVWGMALEHMFPLLPPTYGSMDLEAGEDRDRLIEMVHVLGPGLIIVDSLSRITLRGDSAVEEVRPVLTFLKGLAQEAACAVVLVHHTRKRMANVVPGQEMTMDDLRGSGDIGAAGRTIWGLSVVQTGPEADLNGPRKLAVLKSNLGRVPDPVGCELVPVGEDGVRVAWGACPERWSEPTEADKCAEWLVSLLESEGDSMKPREVVKAASSAGFSRATVYKARRMRAERGRVENTAGAKSPNNEWRLVERS